MRNNEHDMRQWQFSAVEEEVADSDFENDKFVAFQQEEETEEDRYERRLLLEKLRANRENLEQSQ